MTSLRRLYGCLGSRGTAAVEYALILPAFLTLIFGIFDGARLVWFHVSLERAVAIAARCGAVGATDCTTDAAIASKASGSNSTIKFAASAFTVAHESCGVRVHGAVTFRFLTAFVGMADKTVAATFCHPEAK